MYDCDQGKQIKLLSPEVEHAPVDSVSKLFRPRSPSTNTKAISCVAFSANGQYLACGEVVTFYCRLDTSLVFYYGM